MKKTNVKRICAAGILLSVGIVLPFITAGIPQIGNMLLPMHLPVLLAGLLLGGRDGAIIGATLPLLRSVMFSSPTLFPRAIAMSAELLTYGLVVGVCYKLLSRTRLHISVCSFISLVISMLLGRVVWGIVMLIILGGQTFTFTLFLTHAFVNATLGIAALLFSVPLIFEALRQTQFFSWLKNKSLLTF